MYDLSPGQTSHADNYNHASHDTTENINTHTYKQQTPPP